MKNYLNELLYEHKKILIPIIIITLIIGVVSGKFIALFEFNFLWMIIILIILNILILISTLYVKNYDEFTKSKIIKPFYFGLNIICFEVFLYIKYSEVKDLFKKINLRFIPIDFYIILMLNGAFIIFIWIIYIMMFSNVKSTKITTAGIELEIDDTLLSEKQNQFLNDLQNSIENTMKVNGEMERIVAQFISEDFIDDSGEIKESYTYKDLFKYLRKVADLAFSIENMNIITDFKSISELEEIKKEYSIPNNLYNKIFSRIDSVTEDENDIFVERNLVFVNYRFNSVEDERLRKNRVISIIEFIESKEGFSGYGSLMMVSLKMFDRILALSMVPLYGGGEENEC